MTTKYVRYLLDCWSQLNPREKHILSLRFGLGDRSRKATLEEVGQEFGVSRERIRQVEMEAIQKLFKAANKYNQKEEPNE